MAGPGPREGRLVGRDAEGGPIAVSGWPAQRAAYRAPFSCRARLHGLLAGRARDRSRRPDSWPAPPLDLAGSPLRPRLAPPSRRFSGPEGSSQPPRLEGRCWIGGHGRGGVESILPGRRPSMGPGRPRRRARVPPRSHEPRDDLAGVALPCATRSMHHHVRLAWGAWTEPGRCRRPRRLRDRGPVRARARRAVTGFPARPPLGGAVRHRRRGARTATGSVSGRGAIPGGGQRDAPRRAGSRALFPVPREPGVKGPYTVGESTGDRRSNAEPSSAVWRCRPAAVARSKATAPFHAIPATSHPSLDSRRDPCAAPRP